MNDNQDTENQREESNVKAILSPSDKELLIHSLRKKAAVSNIRANFSLGLIISFIAVGIYIFLDAGSIAINDLQPIEAIRFAPEKGGVEAPLSGNE